MNAKRAQIEQNVHTTYIYESKGKSAQYDYRVESGISNSLHYPDALDIIHTNVRRHYYVSI